MKYDRLVENILKHSISANGFSHNTFRKGVRIEKDRLKDKLLAKKKAKQNLRSNHFYYDDPEQKAEQPKKTQAVKRQHQQMQRTGSKTAV